MFETALALVDFALRLNDYHARVHPTVPVLVISIVVAALVAVGATFGGSLVFEHGFNVEIAGDSPAWHVSETDVMPGDRPRLKMRCLPSNDSPTPKWLSRAGHRTHSNTTREEGRAA